MKKLYKLFALLPAERVLLFKALFLLGLVQLGLRLFSFRVQKRLLFRLVQARPECSQVSVFAPEQIAWAVKTASRYVPRATCLPQALVTKALLSRAGYASDLHIGVTKDQDDHLEAHAWVESQGKVVIGGHEPGSYSCLTAF